MLKTLTGCEKPTRQVEKWEKKEKHSKCTDTCVTKKGVDTGQMATRDFPQGVKPDTHCPPFVCPSDRPYFLTQSSFFVDPTPLPPPHLQTHLTHLTSKRLST